MSRNQEIIILFDEQGTPSFDGGTTNFIGVSLLYPLENEDSIMDSCNDSFALSNRTQRKNNRVGRRTAIKMAECLGSLPVCMSVSIINLTDDKLITTVEEFTRLSIQIRSEYRNGVRDRKVAQVLYERLSVDSIFKVIPQYLFRASHSDLILCPFIDHWSFPAADKSIMLDYTSKSLQEKIGSGCKELGLTIRVQVKPIQMLSEDSSRKRLVDGCATIMSRAYLSEDHPRYSGVPVETLQSRLGDRFQIEDITNEEVAFMELFMSKTARYIDNT